MEASSVLRRSENATFEVIADEAIVINMESGSYFGLNKIGTEFWKMLDGKSPITHHATRLAQKYDVTTSQVEADLVELGTRLLSESLITVANG